MVKRFRKIVVNDVEYKWLFKIDNSSENWFSYILISPKDFPKNTFCIKFDFAAQYLLNTGFPAIFRGERVNINLNEPLYVSQIIKYCQNNYKGLFEKKGYQYLNGTDILSALGYEFSVIPV